MPLDSTVQDLLGALGAQGLKPFAQLSVEESRATVETFTGLQKTPQPVSSVVEATYPGPGGELPLRIYTPKAPGAVSALPVVVYFHGGGFVAGSLNVADEPARALANDVGALVVAAGYRLAPDAKFPAATDDTTAALRWVAENIAAHGGDPDRIAVVGDSAGGNLAAVAAQRVRDEGGPQLAAQVLIYPVIAADSDFPSKHEYADYLIGPADLDYFWGHYLNGPEDALDPKASPSRATSLAGLPPALVLTNEYESGRDEAEAYARQLQDDGVATEARRFDGLVHGVFWMSGAVPRSAEVHDAVVAFLRSKLEVTDA
jgi:acetyl esterase